MKIIIHPDRKEWPRLLQRPYADNTTVQESVRSILKDVKGDGDAAVKKFAQRFDGVQLENIEVTKEKIASAEKEVPAVLKKAIAQAAANIETFHAKQLIVEEPVETMPGVQCWRRNVPIEKVGLYVPGGSAPLFSTVLMLGIPARLAGCPEIILCTPCGKDGNVHPAVLYAAQFIGIHRIFKIGGAQAIAAMAYGTATVPAVYKVFGPGNQYVTAAKQWVQWDGVAIDMPAGPSEVCVLADETANPAFVAADLLSQAEHGADSQVMLIATDELTAHNVMREVERQLATLTRNAIAKKALAHSKAIVTKDIAEAIELVNAYAAEHLIICCVGAGAVATKIMNAGSIFIGHHSPESAGDYASGTNHTLPTNGAARGHSGVSVDSFLKKITYQKLTERGLKNLAPAVIAMAEAEGLQAHANAVKIRMVEG